MSRRVAAALVLTLGLARVAGAGGGWTQAIVDGNIAACVKAAGAQNRPLCTCVAETVRQRYALDEYVGLGEAAKQAGKPMSDQTRIVIEDCNRRHNATDGGTK